MENNSTNNLNQIKKKKWFTKWWGIVIIVFASLILMLIINFVFLVFKYKKAIESGEIIVTSVVGQYSQSENIVSNSEIIVNRSELEDMSEPSIGTDEPIMTIVEFSDFDCPYCAVFYPTIKEFALDYSDKVRVIFRDFPLDDYQSALAANCAFEQGRFWDMHDKLFYYQNDISDALIEGIAEDMRLDMESFKDCYDNEKYKEDIQRDLRLGVKAGVEGTPTLFINGEKFAGVIPKSILEQILYAIEYGSEQ